MSSPLSNLFRHHFPWAAWETLIERNGYTLDRPYRSRHPRFPSIIYPMDYGYVDGTTSTDGCEVDVFVGTADTGLVGAILSTDHRQGDREVNLLYRCRPEEVYLAHGFVNYDRSLLEGVLVLRRPMHELWDAVADDEGRPQRDVQRGSK